MEKEAYWTYSSTETIEEFLKDNQFTLSFSGECNRSYSKEVNGFLVTVFLDFVFNVDSGCYEEPFMMPDMVAVTCHNFGLQYNRFVSTIEELEESIRELETLLNKF